MLYCVSANRDVILCFGKVCIKGATKADKQHVPVCHADAVASGSMSYGNAWCCAWQDYISPLYNTLNVADIMVRLRNMAAIRCWRLGFIGFGSFSHIAMQLSLN